MISCLFLRIDSLEFMTLYSDLVDGSLSFHCTLLYHVPPPLVKLTDVTQPPHNYRSFL
ncbi:uncharacterized protein BKA55DRAFT_570846 [Fusarium redolens]|uniref:Uncharacterized protein n=1 Tax=Fusarium redolens TaxID=48865 RepID=A0A9P9H0T5_FUSRE|nr:uncharacterized protein BKA55DRAFT_570846 [Fusarium redolens]KAH7249064.1 hypothetical protein BKA55DRAFT_570846 [Fusarium redolens]